MKRTYIAPKSDIEILNLKGSILDNDPGHEPYSDTSSEVHSNVTNFDEEDFGNELNSKSSLWD